MAKANDFGAVSKILKKIVQGIEAQKDRIVIVALDDLEGRMKRRIFNMGLDSNGRLIGKYSTKPMLIGSSAFITAEGPNKLFSTKKKRSKLEWKTIKTRKGNRALAILEGGYKEFRNLNGRQNSKVDLEFSSDLRNGMQVGTNGGDNVFGFINDLSAKKAAGNEARFKKRIFSISKTERKVIDKAIDREIDQIIKRIVKSV